MFLPNEGNVTSSDFTVLPYIIGKQWDFRVFEIITLSKQR